MASLTGGYSKGERPEAVLESLGLAGFLGRPLRHDSCYEPSPQIRQAPVG